jgi:hypothetical protein
VELSLGVLDLLARAEDLLDPPRCCGVSHEAISLKLTPHEKTSCVSLNQGGGTVAQLLASPPRLAFAATLVLLDLEFLVVLPKT